MNKFTDLHNGLIALKDHWNNGQMIDYLIDLSGWSIDLFIEKIFYGQIERLMDWFIDWFSVATKDQFDHLVDMLI